eukprot:758407-Hanusia_phi.AAC.5
MYEISSPSNPPKKDFWGNAGSAGAGEEEEERERGREGERRRGRVREGRVRTRRGVGKLQKGWRGRKGQEGVRRVTDGSNGCCRVVHETPGNRNGGEGRAREPVD